MSATPRWLRGDALLGDRIVPDVAVEIAGGRIGSVRELRMPGGPPEPPPGETLRLEELGTETLLSPGFVDLHVHGGGGADFMDSSDEAFDAILRAHAAHGTTSVLATTLAAPAEDVAGVLRSLASFRALHPRGASIAGYHLEGPMLSAEAAGAQDRRYLRALSAEEWDRCLQEGAVAGRTTAWVVTLAPELPGAGEVIDALLAAGAIASIGHTTASYEQALAAIARGARRATHLWNAMPRMHHRQPGAVEALLTAGGVTVEVIADGVHLHPAALRLARRARATGEVLLVTDAVRLAGAAEGAHGMLLDRPVQIRDGAPRLADGTLAGSALTMDRAVSIYERDGGTPLPEALRSASEFPAASIGLAAKGRIVEGADADLVVLERTDDGVRAVMTVATGEVVWKRP